MRPCSLLDPSPRPCRISSRGNGIWSEICILDSTECIMSVEVISTRLRPHQDSHNESLQARATGLYWACQAAPAPRWHSWCDLSLCIEGDTTDRPRRTSQIVSCKSDAQRCVASEVLLMQAFDFELQDPGTADRLRTACHRCRARDALLVIGATFLHLFTLFLFLTQSNRRTPLCYSASMRIKAMLPNEVSVLLPKCDSSVSVCP